MIILNTLVRRWYAFAFVGGFFWAASSERGWKRALRFWAIASGVALLFEYTSTHTGFPYGRYSYTGLTRGHEIYVSNIPLFVPLSHAVLIWAGRSIAIVGFRVRSRALIPWLGALGAVIVDLVVDPVSLHGRAWFLGDMYRWHSPGGFFHVPITNFLGWFLAALLVLFVDEAFEARHGHHFNEVRGATLALSVMVFNVAIAVAIEEWAVAISGALITVAVAWVCAARMPKLVRR